MPMQSPNPKNRNSSPRGRQLLGVVVDRTDPKGLGRVKIRIKEVHRGIKDEDLPWVICNSGFGMPGNSPGIGSQNIPEEGTKVWLTSNDRGATSLIMLGPALQEEDKTDLFDSPSKRGFVHSTGEKLMVDDETKTFEYVHPSGSTIKIEGNGNIKVISSGDIEFHASGKIRFIAGSDADVHAGGALNLLGGGQAKLHGSSTEVIGSPLNLNPGGGPNSPNSPDDAEPPEPPKKRDFKNRIDY